MAELFHNSGINKHQQATTSSLSYHSSDENDIMITPHRRNRAPPPKSQSSTKGRAYDNSLAVGRWDIHFTLPMML